jgi:uncharacterized flavoprotein (TIGR03862 family)
MAKSIAVIGSGPSGLMVADQLLTMGYTVSVFDRRGAIGRKLFIAGSSGLNITNSASPGDFAAAYGGQDREFWQTILGKFSPKDWINFLETNLEETSFLGTSGRYFIKSMTAVKLVRKWRRRLQDMGCHFFMGHELVQMNLGSALPSKTSGIQLTFRNLKVQSFDGVILALGGGAWETEYPIQWPLLFYPHQIPIRDFEPHNAGWEVDLPPEFFKESEGLPLKNIQFSSDRGSKKGDIVITAYGLEGTPIYLLGALQICFLDLKPDLSTSEVLEKLSRIKENLSPIRRAKKALNLTKASESLLFHTLKSESVRTHEELAHFIKNLPIRFTKPRPLKESISSTGGLSFYYLNENFMVKELPGLFVTGEMLDWDAPTGGYLIQGCVSLAVAAATGMDSYFVNLPSGRTKVEI